VQQYDLSVSGGTNLVRYFAAGGFQQSDGVESTNHLERTSGRLNLTITPSEKISLASSVGYSTGPVSLGVEGGFGGRVWTTVFANPNNLATDRRGFHSGLPEEYDRLYHLSQESNRLTASVQVTHDPLSWLSHRLSAGLDRTSERNVEFEPRIDELVPVPAHGSSALGYKSVNDRQVDFKTVDYAATASFDATPDVTSKTSFGVQYYRNSTGFVFADGEIFPTPGLSSINATTGARSTAEDFIEDATLGLYLQEQVGWRDRLFLTGAVRADDNSAFGENFDRVYYPKASVSWVVSDEPFMTIPFVSALKLRAAYGEAGKQPQTFSSLRTYDPATGPGGTAAVTLKELGNPDLGPERSSEIELGFDASLLRDRLGLELTYYRKTTTDAILDRDIAPSTGFSGTQFFNAGEIRNTGLEFLARATPVQGERFGWDMSFTIATNDNEILSLGVDELQFVTAGQYLRHQVGRPVGSWFEKRVVSAERTPAGDIDWTRVLCDNGAGGTMPCRGANGLWGGGDDAPAVFLGRPLPTVEGAFANTITLWNRLSLYGLVDFKRGNKKLDGNERIRCGLFFRCRENFVPEDYPAIRIARVTSENNLLDYQINDAGFTKLREVAVSYMLPDAWAARARASRASVSLAGRNLYTWTDYTGLDPEARYTAGTRGGNHGNWEQATLPQLTQWVLTLSVGF
jgi:hypothetical protein